MPSLLAVVRAADNLPPHPHSPYPTHSPDGSERYVPLHLTFADYQRGLAPLGLIRPGVLHELQAVGSGPGDGSGDIDAEAAEGEERSAWQFYSIATPVEPAEGAEGDKKRKRDTTRTDAEGAASEEDSELELRVECVFFADWIIAGGEAQLSTVMRETAERWRAEGKFPGPLAGAGAFANTAFTLERAACALFGLATFGVHMTAYEGAGADMRIWVPRRAKGKATWPGKLDNTVAGGIAAGMGVLETMIKECDEEASLPEAFVRERLRATGVVTYFYITDDGYLQPEVEYIYDLPLPARDSAEYILPKPHDDEVESFALMTVPETLAAMHAGEFKPNCGAILVDFFVRHGLISPADEADYLAIRWSLARPLGVSVPL